MSNKKTVFKAGTTRIFDPYSNKSKKYSSPAKASKAMARNLKKPKKMLNYMVTFK